MFGLSVRWSLAAASPGAADRLREYVLGTSLARFSGMPGLCFKTWRMVEGEWFEGTYVWSSAEARDEFLASMRASAPDAPVTRLVGSQPSLYETWEVVAVAEGAAGFAATPVATS